MVLPIKYKFSLLFVLILGMFTYGFTPNIGEGSRFLYSSEREAEETEEEEEKLDCKQHKVGHTLSKGKNIPFKNLSATIKYKISAFTIAPFDVFFAKKTSKVITKVLFFIRISISPRYILFHRLVFYS